MADRIRDRHRLRSRRADRQLARGRGRRRDRAPVRLPLGARPVEGRKRCGAASAARGARSGYERRLCRHAGARARRAVPAQQVPRVLDPRARCGDRGARHDPAARHARRLGLRGRQVPAGRSRPALRLPGGPVHDHHLRRGPARGRGLEAHRVHPLQRAARQPAELHDPLQPLRPPRLPGAAERPGRGQRVNDQGEQGRAGSPEADACEAGRLRLPVPRRPVRHRGQPHRRPARSRARPLQLLDRRRPPDPRWRLQRRLRQGRGEGRPGSRSTRCTCRASTSPAPSSGSSRSRRSGPDGEVRAPQAGRGHGALPARLARGAVGPRRRGQVLPLPQGARRHSAGRTRSAPRR